MSHPARRATRAAASVFLALVYFVSPLAAQSFFDRTELIDVRYGTASSDLVRSLSYGGFELSDGTPVLFDKWYSSDRRDLSFTLFTQVDESFGVYWGVSTGESGLKYRIEPSLRIGFLKQWRLARHEYITLSARAVVGGWIRERSCVADYGEIGGVQTVNCRLVDSVLPPRETLEYLLDQAPADRLQLVLSYTLRF